MKLEDNMFVFEKKESPLSDLSLSVSMHCNIDEVKSESMINTLDKKKLGRNRFGKFSVKRSLSFNDKENIENQSVSLSKSVDDFLKCDNGNNTSIQLKPYQYPKDDFSNVHFKLSLSSDNVIKRESHSPPKKKSKTSHRLDKDVNLGSILTFETPIDTLHLGGKLPWFNETTSPEYCFISSSTLAKVIKGKFEEVTNFIIIDSRYDYEYNGGHIIGAMNMPDVDMLKSFIDNPQKETIVIFHCEFSSHRGPNALKFMRSLDRLKNERQYPLLFYPELYILKGGYSKFFQDKPELCEPQSYVRMNDERFLLQCQIQSKLGKKRRLVKSGSFG